MRSLDLSTSLRGVLLLGALGAIGGCDDGSAEHAAPIEIPGSDGCLLPPDSAVPLVPRVDASDGDALFAPDALPLFELRFSDEAWDQVCEHAKAYADNLWEIAQHLDPPRVTHEYTEATLVFQGVTYGSIGARFRGRTTVYALFFDGEAPRPEGLQACKDRELPRKPSYKISLDQFGEDEEIGDQQTLNLIAREGADGSYLREVLAQRLSNQFGVVAPRANHARLCVDGRYEGLFSLVEEADTRRFLNQRFPEAPGGSYWKVEADGAQIWHNSWDETGGWSGDYHPKAGTSPDHPGVLEELLRAGSLVEDGEPDADVEAALAGLLDEDAWLRSIALDMALPDYDGMYGNHKNHLLYDHPDRGFVVVPYDRDLALVDIPTYEGGQCAGDILGSHPCWASTREGPAVARWLMANREPEYLATVQELLDTAFDPAVINPWLQARAAAMWPWVAADRYYRPDSPACLYDPVHCDFYNLGAWEYEVSPLLTDAVTARAAEVQRQLDGELTCSEPCGGL